MRPASLFALARPTSRLRRPAPLVALLAASTLAPAGAAFTCMSAPPPDDSAAVSLELAPGVSTEFQVLVYEHAQAEGEPVIRTCDASVWMPLSAFTSVSTRLGTDAVARAAAESIQALELADCTLSIYYEDDVGVELTEQERCVMADYGFSNGSFWSAGGERPCISDEEIAAREAWFREFEEREALERLAEEEEAALAAEEVGFDDGEVFDILVFEDDPETVLYELAY